MAKPSSNTAAVMEFSPRKTSVMCSVHKPLPAPNLPAPPDTAPQDTELGGKLAQAIRCTRG